MKWRCVGFRCTRTADDAEEIPHICSCGLKGRFSYYPVKYIEGFAESMCKDGITFFMSEGIEMAVLVLNRRALRDSNFYDEGVI